MIYTFYDLATGKLTGRSLHCSPEHIVHNVPAGMGYIEGKHDHYCRRFDLDTKQIVPFQPPQPSGNHVWNPASERWELTAEAAQAKIADSLARNAIAKAETNSARALRELLLSPDVRALLTRPQDIKNLERLEAADAAIAAQRPNLTKKG